MCRSEIALSIKQGNPGIGQIGTLLLLKSYVGRLSRTIPAGGSDSFDMDPTMRPGDGWLVPPLGVSRGKGRAV